MNSHPAPEPVGAIGERALIERIRQRTGTLPPHVIIGIGDDAAVIEPDRGAVTVVTTDSLIEDIHFRRTWTAARDIGHKALAVNLSDLAAMGAMPRAATLSLGLPASLSLSEFDDIVEGFLALATEARVALIGGNLSASPGPLVIDVTVLGSAHPRKLLTRDGAGPGDELYLTGAIGGAAAGLAWLAADRQRTTADEAMRAALLRYDRPVARSRAGIVVGRSRAATAAIDLSDGLAEAAWQLAEASGVGLELEAEALPIDPAMRQWAGEAGFDPVLAALSGGEDYELLFAVPARWRGRFLASMRRCRDVSATRIGVVSAGPEVVLRHEAGITPLPRGFRHFGASGEAPDYRQTGPIEA